MKSREHVVVLGIVSALCATLGAGCAPDQEVQGQAQQALGEVPALTSPGGVEAPEPVKPFVDVLKPDAASLAAAPRWTPAALEPAQQARLDASPMPVLLPSTLSPQLQSVAQVNTGAHWYAVSMRDAEHTVYVHGMRTLHEYPSLELSAAGDALTQKPYIISRSHQVVTLSFERFGLSYHMDVTCELPMDDARCVEDDYARALYDAMALVPTPAAVIAPTTPQQQQEGGAR